MHEGRVTHPELELLVEYWLGQGDDDAVEQHLFSCEHCAESLEWVARFTRGVQDVVRRGNLSVVLTPEFLARLSLEGLRVRSYAPPQGGGVECTVTPQDDLLMSRLRADLTGASRVDAVLCDANGALQARLEDILFRPAAGSEIVFNYPLDVARRSGRHVLVMKLVAVENGADRPLAEYTFDHFPTPQ